MCIILLLAGAAKGDYLYPSDSEEGVGINLQLKWEEVEDAWLYIWYLDESWWIVSMYPNTMWKPEYRGWTFERLSAQVNGLEYGTRYYWRVDISTNRHSFEKGSTYNFETITMLKVPEPATICLLGLGALFLKRRR